MNVLKTVKHGMKNMEQVVYATDDLGQTISDMQETIQCFTQAFKQGIKTLADDDIKEVDWHTFHQAAEEGDLSKLTELISAGIPPSIPNTHGMTALHRAAHSNQQKAVDMLILSGVPVDVQDNFGMTPLHHVAQTEHVIMLFLLVKKT